MREIEKCVQGSLEIMARESHKNVKHCGRVERLIHAELANQQCTFVCGCSKKERPNHHHEWFAFLSPRRITATVDNWKRWMESDPYSDDGYLKDEWEQKINYIKVCPDRMERIYAETPQSRRFEALLKEKLQDTFPSFSPITPSIHWVYSSAAWFTYIFSRMARTSTSKKNWKNRVMWMNFWFFSGFLCYYLVMPFLPNACGFLYGMSALYAVLYTA